MRMEKFFMKYNESLSHMRYAYIVEGVTDEDRLKKLGCVFVIKTGGKYIRPDILKFIQEVSKVRPLVIVTDPDGPGKEIKARIEKIVGPCLSVEVNKRDAIKQGKVGIAQMSMDVLKEALRPFVHHDLCIDENFSLDDDDFYDLGLVGIGSKEKRMKLIEKYHIPYTSAKNVEDAMLMLSKNKNDILEVIENGGE